MHGHGGRGQRLADGGVADLGGPFHLAGLGIQRHDRGVGLRQQDHAIGKGKAAVHRVAAHHRDHVRILLRLVGPQDLAVVVQVQRKDVVRERGMDIHHVPDHQRRALMPAQHPGREGPGDAQVLDVVLVDLVQRRIAGVRVIAGLDRPLLGLADLGHDAVIGERRRAGHEQREAGAVQQIFHDSPPMVDRASVARRRHPCRKVRTRSPMRQRRRPGHDTKVLGKFGNKYGVNRPHRRIAAPRRHASRSACQRICSAMKVWTKK